MLASGAHALELSEFSSWAAILRTGIADIENVEPVFKGGQGYDPTALLDSVRGRQGQY
jgi:hypothetical protein